MLGGWRESLRAKVGVDGAEVTQDMGSSRVHVIRVRYCEGTLEDIFDPRTSRGVGGYAAPNGDGVYYLE